MALNSRFVLMCHQEITHYYPTNSALYTQKLSQLSMSHEVCHVLNWTQSVKAHKHRHTRMCNHVYLYLSAKQINFAVDDRGHTFFGQFHVTLIGQKMFHGDASGYKG